MDGLDGLDGSVDIRQTMRKVAKDPVRKAMMADLSVADLSVADLSVGEDEMKKKKRERERERAGSDGEDGANAKTPRRFSAYQLSSVFWEDSVQRGSYAMEKEIEKDGIVTIS